MLRVPHLLSFSLFCIILSQSYLSAQPRGPRPVVTYPEVRGVVTDIPPEIDGKIEAEVWDKAAVIENFTQLEPYTGKPSQERTVVRMLHDSRAVYFLFLCMDSQPRSIVATTMARDEELENDDSVTLFINSLNDNRTVFYFQTNPLSARHDALVTNQGSTIRREWDGIWEVKAGRFSQGWFAEFAIPLETLRFKQSGDFTWKIQFARNIRRLGEESYWAPIPFSQRRRGKYQAQFYGRLTGMDAVANAPRNLQIIPFVTSGMERNYNPSGDKTVKEFGGDLKYGINSSIALDLTYNTDFAQIENDDEQVNLSRFSLFFPEKRDFFMEGAGIFEMGKSARRTPTGKEIPPDVLLFYSRQIGLSQGEAIPIIGGTRLTGRIGEYEVGLLNMMTDSKRLANDNKERKTNFTVARIKRDIFSRSSLGFMYLNKELVGDGHYNRSLGVDTDISITRDLRTQWSIMKTFSPHLKGNDFAGSGGVRWGNSWSSHSVESQYIGEDFNPEMGYVRRPNSWQTTARSRVVNRVNQGILREAMATASATYTSDTGGDLLSRRYRYRAGLNSPRGDILEFAYSQEFEHLSMAEKIRSLGINLPAADYRFNSGEVIAISDPGRLFSGRITYEFGDYYDGTIKNMSGETAFAGFGRLILSARYERGKFKFPESTHPDERITTNLFGSRVIWSFSPDLSVKVFTQWNDTENRITSNVLLRYIFMPGSDIFFVYNESYDTYGRDTQIGSRTAALKIAYRW
jgi:hypothetical protein